MIKSTNGRITADLKCGVLTLNLPKAEEAKASPDRECELAKLAAIAGQGSYEDPAQGVSIHGINAA